MMTAFQAQLGLTTSSANPRQGLARLSMVTCFFFVGKYVLSKVVIRMPRRHQAPETIAPKSL
jgi:hypothetical protein